MWTFLSTCNYVRIYGKDFSNQVDELTFKIIPTKMSITWVASNISPLASNSNCEKVKCQIFSITTSLPKCLSGLQNEDLKIIKFSRKEISNMFHKLKEH